MKNKIESQFIYWEGREFGYKYISQIISNEEDISLQDLEEAIYNHLIAHTKWSNYTIICSNEAKKAANRVFENFRNL